MSTVQGAESKRRGASQRGEMKSQGKVVCTANMGSPSSWTPSWLPPHIHKRCSDTDKDSHRLSTAIFFSLSFFFFFFLGGAQEEYFSIFFASSFHPQLNTAVLFVCLRVLRACTRSPFRGWVSRTQKLRPPPRKSKIVKILSC